ncbi:hypothetical protein H6G54_27155 [Anabaena cylindrica FACHB-243]|nr:MULTISPECIES: hypothetical protein [Anabaena]MBD2421292.1 hypothetical protein [Anabaena cylindrica FACHB-243]MBY5280862.1 hypothetical protein [Anabaena sp. CCAP 1446/1C]MCM2406624.1 hypothetical protein [Anabaena sp. CCAP 1446/1C]BAY01703.1 hypothetical protein NIES19_09390 [Anabaena cylindrica PCC 7122]
MRKFSIGEKLDKIYQENPDFFDAEFKSFNTYSWDLEYFKFKFPVLRNKVAHGKIIETQQYQHIASLLLLDLYYVCNCFFLAYPYVNTTDKKILATLEKVKSGTYTTSDILKIKYAIFYKNKKNNENSFKERENKTILEEKVLNFYDLHDIVKYIDINCLEDTFFDYLSEVINQDNAVVIKGIYQMIASYKQEKIREDKCTKLIIKIQNLHLPNIKNINIITFFDAF